VPSRAQRQDLWKTRLNKKILTQKINSGNVEQFGVKQNVKIILLKKIVGQEINGKDSLNVCWKKRILMKTFEDHLRECGEEITKIVQEKNRAYGDSANVSWSLLSTLFPSGIPTDKFKDALLIIRILDKICRIAQGDEKAFSESPYMDIAGYALIGTAQKKYLATLPPMVCHPGLAPEEAEQAVKEFLKYTVSTQTEKSRHIEDWCPASEYSYTMNGDDT
jgi:hypothetical protein